MSLSLLSASGCGFMGSAEKIVPRLGGHSEILCVCLGFVAGTCIPLLLPRHSVDDVVCAQTVSGLWWLQDTGRDWLCALHHLLPVFGS